MVTKETSLTNKTLLFAKENKVPESIARERKATLAFVLPSTPSPNFISGGRGESELTSKCTHSKTDPEIS